MELLEDRRLLAGIDVELISVDAVGTQGNNRSTHSTVSYDGRFVAFNSQATNLVPNDTNGKWDAFVKDRDTGALERISVDVNGVQANGNSFAGDISADGRYVAFYSDATNLVPNDNNVQTDVFVKDRHTGTVQLVSVAADGTTQGDDLSILGIGGDNFGGANGQFIVFESFATNLVPNDNNGRTPPDFSSDIFRKDLVTGEIVRVSVDANGLEADGPFRFRSTQPAITADGNSVAFLSTANNLVPDENNTGQDLFLKNLVTGAIQRVNVGPLGELPTGGAPFGGVFHYDMTPDAGLFTFNYNGGSIGPPDANPGQMDTFVKDLQTGAVELINIDSSGDQSRGNLTFGTSISDDGRFVAWSSNHFGWLDDARLGVAVKDRLTGDIARVSVTPNGDPGFESRSYSSSISGDGRFVGFTSPDINLIDPPKSFVEDVFIANNPFAPIDPVIGITALIERVQALKDDGTLSNGEANPILNHLKQALKSFNKGKISHAVLKLEQARDEIQNADLDPALGDPLIDEINLIIDELTGEP